MATFLRTAKMNPALAARVEKAVTGSSGSPMLVRRFTAIARVVFVFAVGFAIYGFVATRRQAAADHDKARADLLVTVQSQAAQLDPEDRTIVTRANTALASLAAPEYEGDVVTEAIRHPGELKATLDRSLLWVRGPMNGFAGPAKIAETALASPKDAFLLCFVDPPAARTEKALLDPVRVAYTGGAPVELRTANVRRLTDAITGLSVYEPRFAERIHAASDRTELMKLGMELDRVPFERTKQAVKTRLLLAAIDEPGTGAGPTELDGERPHAVRVALVDLGSNQVLFRKRKDVDPSWISQAKRPTYAAGLDGCALAFDLRAELEARK